MKEYLDIVDEHNNPIGETKLRFEVHTTGLWHRVVHVYFFRKGNSKLEFLTHLRAKTKDSSPNKWDTRFGGHPKVGESIEETVVNEIKEEVGLDISVSDLIEGLVYKREHYPNNEFTKVYYYEFDGDSNLLTFRDNEVQRVKWMSKDDIMRDIQRNPENWSTGVGCLKDFKQILNFLKAKL